MTGAPIDFDWLVGIHAAKRLRLATSEGMAGVVHMDGNPQALVSELIRLAIIGQKAEQLIGTNLDHLVDFFPADEAEG